jgi:arylformamidase
MAASGQSQGDAALREKGTLVFGEYDQAGLDAAYDQAVYAPNIAQVLARYTANSARTRVRLGDPRIAAYGPSAIERLEIFPTKAPHAPILVFLHGGAWRNGRASDYSFPAETFVGAGAHFISVDFIAVTEAEGSLLPLATQIRRAIAWVHANAASFGGDAGRIYLAGHSSGAHLAGVALITDWAGELGLPADVIKGGFCISGMYDLAPVRLSKRSSYVKFDDAMVAALSAIRHIDKLRAPLVVAYGSNETPEFQRQPRDFAAAVTAAGKPIELIVADHYNHFEILETLASPYGLLGAAALRQMQLA